MILIMSKSDSKQRKLSRGGAEFPRVDQGRASFFLVQGFQETSQEEHHLRGNLREERDRSVEIARVGECGRQKGKLVGECAVEKVPGGCRSTVNGRSHLNKRRQTEERVRELERTV